MIVDMIECVDGVLDTDASSGGLAIAIRAGLALIDRLYRHIQLLKDIDPRLIDGQGVVGHKGHGRRAIALAVDGGIIKEKVDLHRALIGVGVIPHDQSPIDHIGDKPAVARSIAKSRIDRIAQLLEGVGLIERDRGGIAVNIGAADGHPTTKVKARHLA